MPPVPHPPRYPPRLSFVINSEKEVHGAPRTGRLRPLSEDRVQPEQRQYRQSGQELGTIDVAERSARGVGAAPRVAERFDAHITTAVTAVQHIAQLDETAELPATVTARPLCTEIQALHHAAPQRIRLRL